MTTGSEIPKDYDFEGLFPGGCKRYTTEKYDRLRLPFPGAAGIVENYSQSMQDMFVLSMLEGKTEGYYVEIGGDRPRTINNTWLLEDKFDWKGVSFEIEDYKVEYFNTIRKNKCVCADATTFDYKTFFEENDYPKQIDYLQLDCDPPHVTLAALNKLPLDDYRFSVITFETDKYAGGYDVQTQSMYTLQDHGYVRVCQNVHNEGNPYEDWWVDPEMISREVWGKFVIDNADYENIILCS